MSELRIKNRSESDLRRFFLGFLCNCLSYFTTAKITFTSIIVKFDQYVRGLSRVDMPFHLQVTASFFGGYTCQLYEPTREYSKWHWLAVEPLTPENVLDLLSLPRISPSNQSSPFTENLALLLFTKRARTT